MNMNKQKSTFAYLFFMELQNLSIFSTQDASYYQLVYFYWKVTTQGLYY